MNEIEKIKRHLGVGVPFELENEDGTKDTITLKPLGIESIPDLLMAQKLFVGMDKDDTAFIKNLNKEGVEILNKIIMDTLKLSIPDADEETLKQFAAQNFMPLLSKIFEINSMGAKTKTAIERAKAIAAVKENRV